MFNALRKGFGLTARTMFRPPVTTEYPEVKREPQPRFHGRHILNRYPDGLEKCIGCELCAWACPADAIFVRGADNTPDERYSPGERYGAVYQINYLRCIFCALCIEACPTRALTMSHEYELSGTSREELIFTKDQLLAPLPDGTEETPHTDAEIAARGIVYYPGHVAQDPLAHYHPTDATVEEVDGPATTVLGNPPGTAPLDEDHNRGGSAGSSTRTPGAGAAGNAGAGTAGDSGEDR